VKLDERLPPLHHRTLRPVLNGKLSMRASTNLWPAESSGSGVVRAEGAMLSLGSTVATAEGRMLDDKGKLYAHATTCLILQPPNH